ncbi:ankyrin repeat domain-containing protein [Ancylobacter pratisalsi]|uniref:Ankyrin repeat domain-containing protein n=1 Tax=Ancylobacter pratisalsi TaxID=1745854 RepID=A0A6P1YNM7_9HYPH|nr:ankyrin repeat domain-containing protein [Ancylobacter pratisalsi]QIB34662.1 ankyrin repeat domain-containing protein [Ancylobacter pratisalsi]
MRRTLFALAMLSAMPGTCARADDTPRPELIAIQLAIRGHDETALATFARRGLRVTDLGPSGPELVALAARMGTPETLRLLHHMGGEIDREDAQGYTPIMRALEERRIDNALALKDLGARLDVVAEDGLSPAALAKMAGLSGFGEGPALAAAPMPPVAANRLLLLASEFGDIEAVDRAIAQGGATDARAANGWSAVMLAALGGHAAVVERLARDIADPSQKARTAVTDAGKMDAIKAALVGEGGGDTGRVAATLKALQASVLQRELTDDERQRYRQIARNIGYDPRFIDAHFPGADPPPSLPALEYDLPFSIASDREGWMKAQKVLRDAGLYRGAIDGAPGEETLAALLAYVAPLEKLLADRGEQAARRGTGQTSEENAGPGYAETLLAIGEVNGPLPAGYMRNKALDSFAGAFYYAYRFPGDDYLEAALLQTIDVTRVRRMLRVPFLDRTLTVTRERDSTTLSITENGTPSGPPSKEFQKLRITQKNQPIQPSAVP